MDTGVIIAGAVAAICAAVPPTIAAYAALKQSRNNGAEVAKNTEITQVAAEAAKESAVAVLGTSAKVDEVNQKATELTAQAEVIHVQTNSQLTSVQSELAASGHQVILLQAQVKTLQDLVALLVDNQRRTN